MAGKEQLDCKRRGTIIISIRNIRILFMAGKEQLDCKRRGTIIISIRKICMEG